MNFDSQRDGWNVWEGADTAPYKGRVEVKYRDAGTETCHSEELRWNVMGTNYDIVAWRPVEAVEAVKPLDVQIGGGHYKKYTIQPVEFITKNKLGFLEGCVIKRICRYEDKNGREDLEKIKHEIDLLIELKYGSST